MRSQACPPRWLIRTPVARSRLAAGLLAVSAAAAAYALAAGALMQAGAAGWASSTAMLVAALSAAAPLLIAAVMRRRPNGIVELAAAPGAPWQIRLSGQGWLELRVQRFYRGLGWLSVVAVPVDGADPALPDTGRPFCFTLWCDAVDALAWRRLCVLALWQTRRRQPPVAQGAQA